MKLFRFFTFAVFFALTGTAYAMMMDIPVFSSVHWIQPQAPAVSKNPFLARKASAKKSVSKAKMESRLDFLKQEFMVARALEKSS